MFFVNLIYGHFDILMFQNGPEKNCVFQGCAKIMLHLHTVRTGIQETLQTCLSASSFHEYPSDTPRQPPNTPQTSPGNSRYQQTTTDDNRRQQMTTEPNRHPQTLTGAFEYVRKCLLAYVVVCCHLLSSVDILSSLEMSGGYFGDVWGVSEGYSWKLEALRRV